jgi:anti-sigma B factor antagonist
MPDNLRLTQPYEQEMMEIRETQSEAYITLTPIGDLDANSSIHLDEKISELIEAGKKMIHVDFSQVNYVSSAGWGVFISYLEEMNARNGKIVLSHMAESVKDVYDLLGLDQLISVAENDEAVANFFI